MNLCALPSCTNIATKGCSISSENRKIHKIMCPSLEVKEILPDNDSKIILDTLTSQIELKKGKETEIRLLECIILFSEFQFSNRVMVYTLEDWVVDFQYLQIHW